MSEKEPLFKKLDQEIFELVDKYKASNTYAQVADQFNTLNETQKKIIGQVLNLIAIFLPLIIVFVIMIGNYQKQNDVSIKKEILKNVERFSYNQGQLEHWGRKIVSPMNFTSKNELQSRLSQAIKTPTLENKPSLNVGQFDQEQLGESFVKTTATVEFTNLSSVVLSRLLREVVSVTKSKVNNLNITKDDQTNFIKGTLEIVHYGKK